eukprot:GHVR01088237.1.p1 GENE.GHVR01088237.1~~GHVR01088237.1.p1  ORF type:complete len:277 (-),score=13.48 GHVR01088237.1:54-884(-)
MRIEGAFVTPDGENHPMYEPPRNDNYLNAFNNLLTTICRSNIDIKPVVSKNALVNYLTNYITKQETSTPELLQLLRTTDTHAAHPPAYPAWHIYTKIINKFVGSRDYSAQEVCHLALGLRGYVSSRSSVSASVDNLGNVENVEGEPTLTTSKYLKYLTRPGHLENLSFFEVLQTTNIDTQFALRRKHPIVRIFPRPKLPHTHETSENYYITLLKKYNSHRDNASLLTVQGILHQTAKQAVEKLQDLGRLPESVVSTFPVISHDSSSDEESQPNINK